MKLRKIATGLLEILYSLGPNTNINTSREGPFYSDEHGQRHYAFPVGIEERVYDGMQQEDIERLRQ